jgi:hypothetical protein
MAGIKELEESGVGIQALPDLFSAGLFQDGPKRCAIPLICSNPWRFVNLFASPQTDGRSGSLSAIFSRRFSLWKRRAMLLLRSVP